MNRIFHHRISWAAYAAIVVLALCALFFLWHRERPASIVVGLLLAMNTVMLVERLLHTSYTFENGLLRISRGRFARERVIDIDHIKETTIVRKPLGVQRYVLLRLKDGREIGLQPADEQAFISEINKRQNA